MISIFAPGTAASARALISSSVSIIETEHRPVACAPSGHRARCGNIQQSGTLLATQTESLCSCSSCALQLGRTKDVGITWRLEIVLAEGRNGKLAWLFALEMGGFPGSRQ